MDIKSILSVCLGSTPIPIGDERTIRPRVHLHLLRFTEEQLANPLVVRDEVSRVRDYIKSARRLGPTEPKAALKNLRSCSIKIIEEDISHFFHRAYHYLCSPRQGEFHLGLRAESESTALYGIMTFSKFDLYHMNDSIPFGIDPTQVLVLSRQISLGPCRLNTWSFGFGRACRWLREHSPTTKMLLTYLDPNIGYRGAGYHATNWAMFGHEHKTRYLFLDGNHVTNREMINFYGTADFDKLVELTHGKITRSVRPLAPLRLYAYFLDRHTRRKAPRYFGHEFGAFRRTDGGVMCPVVA